MSKRPNIASDHEKAVEEEIQAARRERDQKLIRRASVDRPAAEPVVRSFSRGPAQHDVPPEVQAWIEEENRVQEEHYRRIYDEVDKLGPERDVWIREFFERITGPRGYSVHAGTRKTIPSDDIPQRPDRYWRLVW